MKKLRLLSPLSSVIIIGAFMLSFTGCEKDEDSVTNAAVERADNPKQVNISDVRYQFATTMHTGVSSEDKTYSVIVNSDGRIVFNGYQNTAVLGIRTIQLDQARMEMLRDIFAEYPLANNEPNVNPELPTITVTYRKDAGSPIITAMENDIGLSKLAVFSRQVEQIMGVSELVNGRQNGELFPVAEE